MTAGPDEVRSDAGASKDLFAKGLCIDFFFPANTHQAIAEMALAEHGPHALLLKPRVLDLQLLDQGMV